MQESLSNHIAFIDAQEELVLEQFPEADINELGKIAKGDFEANYFLWYGLEDFEELDDEYAAVKELVNLEKVAPAEKMCLTIDGETPVSKKPKKWMDEDNFRCFSRFYGANGYVDEYLLEDEEQCVSALFTLRGF